MISVLASPEIRVQRIMERDGLSESAARARINAQKSDNFYIEHSDSVLYNDYGESEFIAAAQASLGDILLSALKGGENDA